MDRKRRDIAHQAFKKMQASYRAWREMHPNGGTPIPPISIEQRRREWRDLDIFNDLNALERLIHLFAPRHRPMLLGMCPMPFDGIPKWYAEELRQQRNHIKKGNDKMACKFTINVDDITNKEYEILRNQEFFLGLWKIATGVRYLVPQRFKIDVYNNGMVIDTAYTRYDAQEDSFCVIEHSTNLDQTICFFLNNIRRQYLNGFSKS